MSSVLILARRPTPSSAVAEAVRQFHARGLKVYGASRVPAAEWDGLGVDGAHGLWSDADGNPPAFHRGVGAGSPGELVWALVRHDKWTMDRAAEAQVIIALDQSMVYPAWQLAQQRPGVIVRLGLDPALRALDEAPGGVAAPPQLPSDGAGDEPAPRRSWLDRFRKRRGEDPLAVDITEPERVRRALAAIDRMRSDGDERGVARVAADVAERLKRPDTVADLWGELVARDLVDGVQPRHLRDAVHAELALADHLLARKRAPKAMGAFLNATRMIFHRAMHMDSTMSPLAADPEGYLEPLHASELWRQLTKEWGRAVPAAVPPRDRPTRLLLVTNGNTNFVGDLVDHLGSQWGVEVRSIAPDDLPHAAHWRGPHGLRRRLLSDLVGNGKARADAEADLREHFDWADVAFIDWCTAAAHYVLLADPGTTRVILRLHSYEAFTVWPQLIDYSRVDRMVFVSDHLRDLTERAVPQVRARGVSCTIPNAMDLTRFVLPKESDSRFTIAVLGFHVVAKDVRWAMDVITGLRAIDPRYRLKLIGSDFVGEGTPAFRRYRRQAHAEMDRLEADGGLIRFGRTEDVPGSLTDVGVILSSSVREGSPLAVLEGAASGAVPVVRDWPFFAAMEHGPRTIYPGDWIVDSVAEAVERIARLTGDEEEWRRHSAEVSAATLSEWDLDTTQGLYEDLFYGE